MKNNWEIYFEINKSQYKSKYHWEKYKYLIFQGPQIQIQVQIYWYSKRQTQIWHFLDIWGLKYPRALVPKYICTQLCRSLNIWQCEFLAQPINSKRVTIFISLHADLSSIILFMWNSVYCVWLDYYWGLRADYLEMSHPKNL